MSFYICRIKKVYVSTAILLLKFIDIFCILPQLRWNINPLRDKPLVAPKTEGTIQERTHTCLRSYGCKFAVTLNIFLQKTPFALNHIQIITNFVH